MLPPTVSVQLDEVVGELLRARLLQHTKDSYVGVPLSKFPEDLRVYEHLLWLSAADVVIELGVQYGGSALWFRDRLMAHAHYRGGRSARVIGVDVDIERAQARFAGLGQGAATGIQLVPGDLSDPGLPARVRGLIEPGARCLVVEDSAHDYETTSAALRGFAQFVSVGGFFVVEDGVVDVEALRVDEDWPRGVRKATEDWLQRDGSGFVCRRDLELYGLTCHPHGFLQRQR